MGIRKTVNITIDSDVLNRIEFYADRNGLSRSGAISVLCNQMISANDSLEAIDSMNKGFDKLNDVAEQMRIYNEHQVANRKARRKKIV